MADTNDAARASYLNWLKDEVGVDIPQHDSYAIE